MWSNTQLIKHTTSSTKMARHPINMLNKLRSNADLNSTAFDSGRQLQWSLHFYYLIYFFVPPSDSDLYSDSLS